MNYSDLIQTVTLILVVGILALVLSQNFKLYNMAQEIEDLKAAVANEGTVVNSAIVLLNGLKQRLDAALEDPAALRALSADIGAQSDALAAAIVANTPLQPGQ